MSIKELKTNIKDMRASALGVDGISVSTQDKANASIGTLDDAIKMVSKQRADLGAYQRRLESIVRTVDIGAENLTASRSRIMRCRCGS